MKALSHLILAAAAMALIPHAALAHIGAGSTTSFLAGFWHPFGGLDHLAVMVAVGLLAALNGGRALWLWPVAFVIVMLIGGDLGMAHIGLPLVEPAILASVILLGLLVAFAVDLPIAVGAAIVGVFALFHGHAHGSEAVGGLEYMAGFALATATLHLTGIAIALAVAGTRMQGLVRLAGASCIALGVVLAASWM